MIACSMEAALSSQSRKYQQGTKLRMAAIACVAHSCLQCLGPKASFQGKRIKKTYYCLSGVSEICRCPQNIVRTHAITSQKRVKVPKASR